MPAGVSWSQYLKFSTAAMLSMLAGAQVVHVYYRPMENLEEYIYRELKNLPNDVELKIKQELKEEGVIK